MFMIDRPEDEANDIAMLVPTDLNGPATLVRVRFGDEADVQVPIDEATAARFVSDWSELIGTHSDPRGETKNVVITAFQKKAHLTENGIGVIAAAVLYYTMTSGNEKAVKDVLKAGGHCLFASITHEGAKTYRFRVELVPLT